MIDFDKIFNQDAFKSIEKERLELFKELAKKIENKSLDEAFVDIVSFFNTVPKGSELSNIEKQAIIECIIHSLSKDEQKKFISILEIIENFA